MLAHHLDKVGEILVAEEDFALAVLYVVLQVEGDGLGGAEVLHVVADGLAQVLEHAEEVVDAVLAVEDDGGVVAYMDAGLAELGGCDAHHIEKLVESDVDIVFVDKISVGRLLQISRRGLRNQYFFDFHTLSVYSLNCMFYCKINHFNRARIGIDSTMQR